jgi:hypothetical protein
MDCPLGQGRTSLQERDEARRLAATFEPAGTSNSNTATDPADCSPSSRKRIAISPTMISSRVLAVICLLLSPLSLVKLLDGIRAAVAETEDSWAQQLGPKRFNQLRLLLRDLQQTS